MGKLVNSLSLKNTPLVSVIVPCYNQAQYLGDALDSILAQTYTNWECIIVNDGSKDRTENTAAGYISKDPRFKYEYQENGGLSSARNKGLQVSLGSYIQFLDGDDFLQKDKFMTAMTVFSRRPEIQLVLSNYQLYHEELKQFSDPNYDLSQPITSESIIKNWDISFAIPIHCGLFDRQLVKDGFNETLRAKEDWLMWIRIFGRIQDYYFVNDFHAYYRMHSHNMIKNYELMQENTLSAYRAIHQMIVDTDLKNIIFNRYADLSSQKIKSLEKNYHQVLSSHSYKAGNLLITPFTLIKNWLKRNSSPVQDK